MGICKLAGITCAFSAVIIAIIMNSSSLPPNIEFEEFSVSPSAPFEGLLAINSALNGGERLFNNEILAPEGLAVHKNVLYSALADGRVVSLNGDKLKTVVDLRQPCKDTWNSSECGRLLGLSFDKAGSLYVVDCYFGIYKVNVTTGASSLLIPSNKPINNELPLLPDAVAVAADGTLFWSDASTKFPLHQIVFSGLGDSSGRLIRTNPKTGQSDVLISGLHFANGVYLAEDESYVAVAETFVSRIHRYWLKGPKKGKSEVFIDNLPGLPDNISPHKDGFVVSLITLRNMPILTETFAPFPSLRKFVAKLLGLIQVILEKIDELNPSDSTKKASYKVTAMETFGIFVTNEHSGVQIYDKNGKLLRVLYSTDGVVPCISDFAELKGNYYLGSPTNPFLGKVKIPK